ncbi:hypothetical protein HMPREF0758_4062 [Serratia odorifera DSM 4582]|uniref:Uncharacterized protein n=1 Tax=Serratia odorifera DSM 4582 TaxID=667129 RepID=D4E7B2_SEROD|nr:hypothetical protein HMPREF0758_4062 [Serratia odorifera DSM 4582]
MAASGRFFIDQYRASLWTLRNVQSKKTFPFDDHNGLIFVENST